MNSGAGQGSLNLLRMCGELETFGKGFELLNQDRSVGNSPAIAAFGGGLEVGCFSTV